MISQIHKFIKSIAPLNLNPDPDTLWTSLFVPATAAMQSNKKKHVVLGTRSVKNQKLQNDVRLELQSGTA